MIFKSIMNQLKKYIDIFRQLSKLSLGVIVIGTGVVATSAFSFIPFIGAYGGYAVGILVGIIIYRFGLLNNNDEFIKQNSDDLNNTNTQLRQENQYLRKQQINIDNLKEILELSLLELNTNITDIRKEQIDEDTEYLGLYRQNFSIKYGIDFEKLKFKLDGNKIDLYGITSKPLDISHGKGEYLLSEIRHKGNYIFNKNKYSGLTINNKNVDKIIIDSEKQSNLAQHIMHHRNMVIDRIENGLETNYIIDDLLKNKSETFFRKYFNNFDLKIHYDIEPPSDAVPLRNISYLITSQYYDECSIGK